MRFQLYLFIYLSVEFGYSLKRSTNHNETAIIIKSINAVTNLCFALLAFRAHVLHIVVQQILPMKFDLLPAICFGWSQFWTVLKIDVFFLRFYSLTSIKINSQQKGGSLMALIDHLSTTKWNLFTTKCFWEWYIAKKCTFCSKTAL